MLTQFCFHAPFLKAILALEIEFEDIRPVSLTSLLGIAQELLN